MNKEEFARKLAKKRGISIAEARKVSTDVFNIIKDALRSGDSLELVGFGRLFTTERKARRYRNPNTKQIEVAPEYKTVSFKTSPTMKKSLNSK